MAEILFLILAIILTLFLVVWVMYMLIAEFSAVTYVPSAPTAVIEILKNGV